MDRLDSDDTGGSGEGAAAAGMGVGMTSRCTAKSIAIRMHVERWVRGDSAGEGIERRHPAHGHSLKMEKIGARHSCKP
eukprot:5061537-Pleurochrysis_carterae.AAC.2